MTNTTPTSETLQIASLLVARHFYGDKGVWAYSLFEELNKAFFDSQLPWPHISWAITPYGACLGYSYASGPPVIVLHPSLLHGSEKANPWGVPSSWLGWRFAADVLLHEMIHLSVIYRLGGWSGSGETSHNNPAWVAEVNRLISVLRIPATDLSKAGMTRTKRIPIEGPLTARGKMPSTVIRATEGNLPFSVVAGFPGALRQHVHQANRYYQGLCPAFSPAFDPPLDPGIDAGLRSR